MTQRLRALLWIAVSSEKQAGDKVSLVEQERAERAWCAEQGYEIVGVLSVPGESRSDTDVLSIFEDFAAKNVYAYHDLRKMWQAPRQFDVLVAYHDCRLGRSEALFAYVVSNVMRAGAKIYTILGGWYMPDEYQMKMFMGMASVSNEMKRFVALTKATNLKKAEKGVLVHGPVNFAYIVERDLRGQPLRKIPDEFLRPAIEAAVKLVVDGVGWRHIEDELNALGFTKHGKRFTRYNFYYLFHNPNFYGHEVITTSAGKNGGGKGRKGVDLWIFDPTYSTPADSQIFYNVMPPYLANDPDLENRLKNEMRRRRHSIRGSARSLHAHKFTGLLTCYYCGRSYVFHPVKDPRHHTTKYPCYMCHSKYNAVLPDRCDRTRSIGEKKVIAWFDQQLRDMLKEQDPEHFIRRGSEQDRLDKIVQYEVTLKKVTDQLDRAEDELIAATSDRVRLRMRGRVEAFAAEQVVIENQITALEALQVADTGAARQSYERILAYPDLEAFWTDSDNIINQVLHGLLGEKTILIKDRQVWGDAAKPH